MKIKNLKLIFFVMSWYELEGFYIFFKIISILVWRFLVLGNIIRSEIVGLEYIYF